MKTKTSWIIATLLATVVVISTFNLAFAATTLVQSSSPQAVSSSSATGNGWFAHEDKRDNFNFYVVRGTLKGDGWRYAPNGQVSYRGRDLMKADRVIQVWNTRVWRFRIDKIDGGNRVTIAGIATVKIGQDFRDNWWFRVTARDMTDPSNAKDGFMIQLWRPIGAGNTGGWTAKDFDPTKPATLHLNSEPFYQAQGALRSGNIQINP